MSALRTPCFTEAEYLERERKAETKSEFIDGEIVAMSGGSRRHATICGNVHAKLHQKLEGGPCQVFNSDMRVRIAPTGAYVYPDVSGVCADAQFSPGIEDTLLNPVLIVEVLSPSTEAYDEDVKSAYYRRLPSLQDYVLIAQSRVHVQHFTRYETGQWLFKEYLALDDTLPLVSVGVTLAVADIYARVSFEEASTV